MAAIDRIRDGVPADELRAGGDGAVYGYLVSTAMAHQRRHLGFRDWAAEVDGSNLGRQAQIVSKTLKPRSRIQHEKQLVRAWNQAREHRETQTLPSPEEFRAEAKLLGETLDLAGALDLADNDRTVLRHVLTLAEEWHSRNPTVPCRPVSEALGWGDDKGPGPRRVCRCLKRLVQAGWLTLMEQGSRGTAPGQRASRYGIPVGVLTSRLQQPDVSHTRAGVSVCDLRLSVCDTNDSTPKEGETMTDPMITITRDTEGRITATLPPEGGDLETLTRTLAEAGLSVRLDHGPEQTGGVATVTVLAERRGRTA